MKKHICFSSLFVLALFVFQTGFTQNTSLSDYLRNIQEKMESMKNYSAKWNVSYYDFKGEFREKFSGEIYQKEDLFYKVYRDKTILNNGEFFLGVNHNRKTIRIRDLKKMKPSPVMTGMDMSWYEQTSARIIKEEKGILYLEIPSFGSYEFVEVLIDLKLNHPISIEYTVQEEFYEKMGFSKILIDYHDVNLGGDFSERIFSIDRFLKKKSGAYVSHLKGYKVLNYTNKK